MSETVHYTGKLTIVDKLEGETLEQQCERIIQDINGGKIGKFVKRNIQYNSWEDMLTDIYYDEYHIQGDNLYKIESKEDVDMDYEIFELIPTTDGYEYEVRYYDGGCGFNEAIGWAFDNLNK